MIPAATYQYSAVPPLERICFIVEGTAAMSPFWQDIRAFFLDPILRDLESRGHSATEPHFELALIVCGSATPWSQCPLERSGWTQNLSVFRQWLDAFQPLGGGLVPQPLVAEAVADAVYMLQSAEKCSRMLHPEMAQKAAQNRVVLCVVSEPSRLSVPWPYPADCRTVAGKASHAELCQALRSHGADFSFAAGQVQGGKMLYSRLVRTFALAHDLKQMTEVKACLLDSHPNVVFCISPQWPAAKSVIQAASPWTQMLAKQGQVMSEARPKPAQAPFGKLPEIAAQAAMQMAEGALVRPPTPGGHPGGAPPSLQGLPHQNTLGMPPLPMPAQNSMQPSHISPGGQPQRRRVAIWTGTMLLGEKLNKGHATRLWTCTAILDSSHPIPAGMGSNWPRELAINKLSSANDLITIMQDRNRGLLKGVLETSHMEETGKALARTMAVKKLVGVVDLGTLIGVTANLMVMVVSGKESPSGQPAGQIPLQYMFMIMTSAKEQRPA
ncbi:probable mediator of RNA polymerase II transcription subunit 25 at N-terminal half [Coccomyxa sp. Obi]|nr:probable mediator of RNA polymerase II transcription subunit 25 at N-terminal half [Coccomyxa sp. Obi]